MSSPTPYRILYVDDETALLEVTRIFLERAGGITVDITDNPRKALEMIRAGRYDAVVSDYQMPEMDGIALLKEIRKTGSRIPFIIFTGRGREEVAIEALNSGADFYIQKGGDPGALFAELANAVRQLSGRQRAEAAVLQSKEMLHKAESLAHVCSWELDYADGKMTWSDEATQILGLDIQELPATIGGVFERVHPDDRNKVEAAYFASIADGKAGYESNHRILHGDTGDVQYVIERCEHQRDASGKVARSLGMVHDITASKLAEIERLREHEELQAAYKQLASMEEELRTSFDDLADSQQHLKESEERVRKKLESILSPGGDIGNLELADIIDAAAVQSLMDDFYSLAKTPVAIIDKKGSVLAGAGWQEICTMYHRVHPETCEHCVESDTQLSAGVPAGESKLYRCKNNMWDVATPIIVGGRHLGNVFSGQFFFEDEEPDYAFFRAQAQQYGFDEEGYLAVLAAVPRLNRKTVDAAMAFLREFAALISRLSYSNITLARSLAEHDALTSSLKETRSRLIRVQEIAHIGSWEFNHQTNRLNWSDETSRIFGLNSGRQSAPYGEYLSAVHPDDRDRVASAHAESVAEGRDGCEIEHRILRADTAEVRYVIERCEHQRDESGRYVRSLGMVHDITDRKLAELERSRRHDELQAAYEQLASVEEDLRKSFDDLARNQERLKVSEEQYRCISDCISDVVYSCVLQDTGEYVLDWIAGAVHEITGYAAGELKEMRCWRSIVHPGDIPVFEREVIALSPGAASLCQLRIVRQDERIRWLRVSSSCVGSGNGTTRLYGGWQDITDQKAAEEALQESELHFRTLADSGQALIWTSGVDGMCDYFNKPWLAFTGRTLEQEVGDGWTDGVHPDDRSRCLETYTGAFTRRERFSMTYRLRRHDGEYRWIQDDASPRYDTHGNFLGYIGHCLDVTEQRRAKEALRETAEKMESIFRAAPTGIGTVLGDVFSEVNDRACEISGYTREEMIGQSVRLLYPDDAEYASDMREMYARIATAETCTLETRSRRKDGAIIDVLLSISPLNSSDLSRGMTFTLLDITERKVIEREIEYHAAELARQTNSLAVVNKKLNLMSSITRHDILNQLTVLTGNLLFAREAGPGEDTYEYLTRVQTAADWIHRQIEFTRDYTELGVRAPEWQRVPDVIRPAALHGLPIDDEAGDLLIYADSMLATVFSNLMDNTLRHGETATRIHIWYRPEESGALTLVWEDNGVGVPAEEKERIFDRGVGKNTGLGLFLIREILEITGIAITETGEPGKGARFEMLVPREAYRLE